MLKAHNPPAMFAPVGPYCHGLEVVQPTRFLFSSGTMGLDREGHAPDGIEAQLETAWDNLKAILAEAGMTVGNIVKVTTFLADRSLRGPATAYRQAVLGDHKPAVTTMVAGLLQDDWLVEIEIVAAA
ncbi:RidA family protein [Bosea vaviloviae]|nr:RidA family protein [Bosea vaviloviae]